MSNQITDEEFKEFDRISKKLYSEITREEKAFYERVTQQFSYYDNLTFEEFKQRVQEEPFNYASGEDALRRVRNVSIRDYKGVSANACPKFEYQNNRLNVYFNVNLRKNCPDGELEPQLIHELLHVHWRVQGSGAFGYFIRDVKNCNIEELICKKEKDIMKAYPELGSHLLDILKHQNKVSEN